MIISDKTTYYHVDTPLTDQSLAGQCNSGFNNGHHLEHGKNLVKTSAGFSSDQ